MKAFREVALNLNAQTITHRLVARSGKASGSERPSASRHATSGAAGCWGLTIIGLGLLLMVAEGAFLLLQTREDKAAIPRPSVQSDDASDTPTRTPQPDLRILTPPITTGNVHQVKELARLGRGTVNALAVSPDGTKLAVAGSLGVWLYDLRTRIPDPLRLLESPVEPLTDVAWSPDGAQLASAAEFTDNAVRMWDASTALELHALIGHTDEVNCVAWSPDGARLASGGDDGTVRVWGIPGE